MTSNIKNRRWVLASYPDGMPDESHFRLEEVAPPELQPGEVLVQTHFLSVDPYMRGRMSPAANYAAGVAPGDVMAGGGVGEVIESRSEDFKVGDFVESMSFGWQAFSVLGPEGTRKVDPGLAPIQSSLGYLGMPGRTAYFGLFKVINAQPGETIVISAASGAVGQVAGQLAKLHGCRVVAVASSDAKLDWCREIGYDDGVNYRNAGDLSAAFKDVCPDGIDGYFDNTAGPIHDAVMENLALKARIAVCGTVSLADKFGEPDIGPRYHRQILVNRARIEGFLVFDFAELFAEADQKLAAWAKAGQLVFKEDIAEGIEQMPGAFLKLLNSENFGKQLVKLAV